MYGYVYNIYICMCLGLASIDSLTHILMQMTHLTPKNCVNLRWGVCLGIWPVSRFKGAGGGGGAGAGGALETVCPQRSTYIHATYATISIAYR